MDLECTFTFRNSKQTYSGIPIIVANMDTVGTFEMAAVMSQVGQGLFSPRFLTLDRLSEACLDAFKHREGEKSETLWVTGCGQKIWF